ncbi:MAG: DEAD/DEAH box helicase, partial [Stenotrophomonas sp.]
WWNPAAENQATDRAHRIGQDQPVFVYKLIAAGSIEERIADLQQRKADLADAILEGGGGTGPRFDAADLEALLSPLPGAPGKRSAGKRRTART